MRLTNVLASTAAANGVAFVLALPTSILLTRLLGPEGRGEFAIFIASTALFALLLSLGLDFAITYAVARGEVSPQRVFTSALLQASLGAAVFFCVVVGNDRLTHTQLFLPSAKQHLGYEALAAALVLSSLVSGNVRSILLGAREFWSINASTVAFSVLPIPVYGVLNELSRHGHFQVSTGGLMVISTAFSVLSSLVLVAAVFFKLRVRWSTHLLELRQVKTMATVGTTAYVAMLCQFLNYRVDFWIVKHFAGFEALGLYSLASTLAQTVWLVPRSAASVFFPVVASGDRSDIGQQTVLVRLLLLAFVPLGIVSAFASHRLIGILYGRDFSQAAMVFNILLIGCIPFAATIVLASGLAAKGRQIENTRASFWGLATTVVLDLLLIPRYGMVGAAVASAFSYLVTTAYAARQYSRLFEIPFAEIFFPHRGDAKLVWSVCKRSLGSSG
jgi:O-antigen/teichoic acid export membrane protein